MNENTKINGINSAKDGCSYIVMSDRTGTNFRTSNVAGHTAKFFCKQTGTTTVEQYPVEVTAWHFDSNGKMVDAVWTRADVTMCEKHARIAEKKLRAIAKAKAQRAATLAILERGF
jgi:ribosomal protein S17E